MDASRRPPQVDSVKRSELLAAFPEAVRTEAARRAIDDYRRAASQGPPPSREEVEWAARAHAERLTGPRVRTVLNASGVILHTGLGRARLAPSVAKALAEAAEGHLALEIDLTTGSRGDRQEVMRDMISKVVGGESSLVVNNCAAAVYCALSALGAGKEVLLSRGEMVEIGGSFRMPEVIKASGCRLVEVGCTNKTRLADYERAMTPETAVIVRCHRSNFKMTGFVESPSSQALAELARSRGIVFLEDVGSGCLVDTSQFGAPKWYRVQDALAAGAHIVTFSGDKLLGGPQAGLLVGDGTLIDRIARHPSARASRVDKLTVVALSETLRLYWTGRSLEIPTLAYLARSLEAVREYAERIAAAAGVEAAVEDGITEVGGGCGEGEGVATVRVGLTSRDPIALATSLRQGEPSILTRIERGRVWIDPRTLEPEEVEAVVGVLKSKEEWE